MRLPSPGATASGARQARRSPSFALPPGTDILLRMSDWFDRIPKVELHLHLEGAIPVPVMWELLCKYGGDPEVPDQETLRRRYEYRDFSHFIRTWLWQAGYLREYDDFTFLAQTVAEELTEQRIVYVEAFFSPPDYHRHGLETGRLIEAVRGGLERVPGVEVALVPDLVRNYGPAKADRTLSEVAETRQLGVIGIGLGGSEERYPPEPFAPVFERARSHGLRTSAHAGEVAGPESVWGAVRALRVDRIGHGVRAGEDETLVEHLAREAIPIEMCLVSNLRTGAVPSLDEHPVRRFFERGLTVTVNTDDPVLFGTTLANELRLLERRFGFTRREVKTLQEAAARASWLPEERRHRLEEKLRSDPVWDQA